MAEREKPFLGVPAGNVRVENPDGVYLGGINSHNLYDRSVPLARPIIPGDYDLDRPVTDCD